jgi:hypothetical protein
MRKRSGRNPGAAPQATHCVFSKYTTWPHDWQRKMFTGVVLLPEGAPHCCGRLNCQLRHEWQVIGCYTRSRAVVCRDSCQGAARMHPYPVQREQRKPGRVGARLRSGCEVPAQPAQRPPPEQPFIEVAEQHGKHRWCGFIQGKQAAHLQSSLAGAQAKMSRYDLHALPVPVEHGIQGTTGFALRQAQVDPVKRQDGKSCQQGVAVIPGFTQQCGTGDCRHACYCCQVVQQVDAVNLVMLDFLQRKHVRIQLPHDAGSPVRVEAAIGTDTGVNIVCGEFHTYMAWSPVPVGNRLPAAANPVFTTAGDRYIRRHRPLPGRPWAYTAVTHDAPC